MANYDFVVNTQFKPFSMQEMLVPYQLYKEGYDTMDKAFSELSDKANVFKYLSSTLPEDSTARKIYEGYARDLSGGAGDFLANGPSQRARKTITSMRRRYQGEIGRLVTADAERKKAISMQTEVSLKDPTRLFAKDARLSTIDDYLDGKQPNTDSYSGAMLTQQASNAAAALAKGIASYADSGKLDDYTKTWIDKHGLSADEVLRAVQNPTDPEANPVLRAIVDSTVNSTSIPSWGDASTLARARQYAAQGLWSAVGQSTIKTYEDYGARLQAEIEKAKAVAAAKGGGSSNPYGGGFGDGSGTIPINTDQLLSPNMDGAKGRETTLKALHTLGFSDDGKRVARRATWVKHTDMGTGSSNNPVMSSPSIPITIWNSNKTLKTREQFIRDNRGVGTSKELGAYYDNSILPSVSLLTGGKKLGKGQSWTQSGVAKGASIATQGTGSHYLGAFRINLGEDGNKKAIQNIVNVTQDQDGYLSGVRKVKSWNSQGGVQVDDSSVKASELVDGDGNIQGSPTLYSTPADRNHVFIRSNGNMYAVEVSKLGSIGVSVQYGPSANVGTYETLIKNRDAILMNFLARGMTPEQAWSRYNDAVDNAGAGYIRDISAALSLEYKQNPYTLNQTSKTATP